VNDIFMFLFALQILLQNLTTNIMYEVRVRGGTRSVLEPEKVYKGQYSDSRKILMQPNCEKVRMITLPHSATEFTPTLIGFSIVSIALIVLVVLAYVVWRFVLCSFCSTSILRR
jgi:receptor-type tyrosine-protein phosphatase gamma